MPSSTEACLKDHSARKGAEDAERSRWILFVSDLLTGTLSPMGRFRLGKTDNAQLFGAGHGGTSPGWWSTTRPLTQPTCLTCLSALGPSVRSLQSWRSQASTSCTRVHEDSGECPRTREARNATCCIKSLSPPWFMEFGTGPSHVCAHALGTEWRGCNSDTFPHVRLYVSARGYWSRIGARGDFHTIGVQPRQMPSLESMFFVRLARSKTGYTDLSSPRDFLSLTDAVSCSMKTGCRTAGGCFG